MPESQTSQPPTTPKASPPSETAPRMVLPPPAPQNELEGLKQGYENLNKEAAPERGVEIRLHPDIIKHPTTRRFQSKY